ncbi:MAG: ATP-binding protein, partial [Thermoanaerobaculia bacterium]
MQLRSPGAATPIASRPPVSLTSLVGREREILDLSALVRAQRLVTLTGVGGSGKTRLAAELALRIDWQQADSVAWVELAPCTVAESVTQATASALSLRVTQPCELVDAIVDALHDHELLLVLDDCEHLIAASAELARALLVRCPKLRILATSREPLGIAGEHVWPVPPIAPDEAIQLFVERAAAANPSMQIDREIARDICTRLDGIPLAIELAAARVRVLTPEQIAARLEDRFAILTSGSRTTIPRHRTLRAAIDWSFALLTLEEQTLLARLSIFAGSFSLEAAELICEADLDLLTGLVDKSLVVTTSRRATIRYHLLETIRQYARERLETSGDADALRRRHALAYSKLVHEAAVDPMGAVLAHLDRLDADRDNVLAALAWSLEHEPDELALPLGAAFRWYWYYRILWNEGLRWLKRVLERTSPSLSHERAAGLAGAGTLASYLGDFETARRWLEEAVSMDRTLGNERELALATSALAHLLGDLNELDEAWSLATESIALARKAGTPYDIAYCLTNALAFVAQRRGDLGEADLALEEAEAIWSPMQHPLGVPLVVNARALVALRRGDHTSASTFARRALESTRTSRERWFTARSLRILAITSSDLTRAAKLSGAAEAMLRGIGARMLPHDRDAHAEVMNKLHASLPLDGLQAALAEGNAMCFDEACELALDDAPLLGASNEMLHVSDLGALQITL